MKRAGLIFVIVLLVGAFSRVQAQRAIKNGFSINAVFGFPSENFGVYGMPFKVKTLYGIKLGNRWYFNPNEKYGFGLMVNWFDISLGVSTDYIDNTKYAIADIVISAIELGPIGTYAISGDMAIDGYYNLKPTVFSSAIANENEDSYAAAGIGFSHVLGAAFRYKVLNIGLEYSFGSVNVSNEEANGIHSFDNSGIMKINSFRIVLGAKF